MGAGQWLCRGALRHFSTGFVPRLDRLAVPLVRLVRHKVAMNLLRGFLWSSASVADGRFPFLLSYAFCYLLFVYPH